MNHNNSYRDLTEKATMKKETRITPYPLRIPSKLREWVENRADKNRRSLNTELNVMLEMAQESIREQELASNEQS